MLWVPVLLGPAACSSDNGSSAQAPPTGHYEGTLTHRGAELRVVFELRQLPGGHVEAELSVPSFQSMGWSFDSLRYQARQLASVAPAGAGTPPAVQLRHDTNFLRGTATLNDSVKAELLLLRRGPAEPRPWAERRLRIATPGGTATATLLVPVLDTLTQHPAVVMLHAAGRPQAQHLRPHAELLARHGIAALIFDRRDAGNSKGQAAAFGLPDLTDDALAAVQALKRQPEVDSSQVGAWGTDQGATVAGLLASRPGRPVDFVVGISGPGVALPEVMQYQNAAALRQRGATPKEQGQARRALTALTRYVLHPTRRADSLQAAKLLEEAWQQPWAQYTSFPKQLPDTAAIRTQLQWREMSFDPRVAWQRVRVPALLVYGTEDDRFDGREAAQRMRGALGGRRGSVVRLYPDANHDIMVSGATAEAPGQWQWPRPAPGYLEDMLNWLKERAAR